MGKLNHKIKLVLLSSLGGGLEFYDFIIFAIFSIEIGNSFFPHESSTASLIGAYSLFAIGYLARPIGGMLFSHFGDKFGRCKSFALTISVMAATTLLMGIMPNYTHWGLTATVLFTLLRIIQGMSIGGEIPGAITFVSEHLNNRPGLSCGLIIFFLNMGMLLAQAVRTLLHFFLSNNAFHLYGWRIAFLLGGTLAIVSFYLRKDLQETPVFLEINQRERFPLLALFKQNPRELVSGIFVAGLGATIVSIYLLYFNAYLQTIINYPRKTASTLILLQLVIMSILNPLASFVSDYLGRRKLLIVGSFLLLLTSPIYFKLMQKIEFSFILVALNGLVISIYLGAMPCYLSELFPPKIRYSGVAISYNLAFALFGGLTPLLATFLVANTSVNIIPSFIIVLASILALLSLMAVKPQNHSFKSQVHSL